MVFQSGGKFEARPATWYPQPAASSTSPSSTERREGFFAHKPLSE